MNEPTSLTPAEIYETFMGPAIFRPLAQLFVRAAARPRAGERALDLACGTGMVARHLAPEVGPEGRVVGVDRNPGMLAVARSLAPPVGAKVDWVGGDAVALPLPGGSFDLVTCQQGLQFFPDRAAALEHVRRVLAPGGRVALALWRSIEHHPVFAELAEAELAHLGPLGVTYDDVVLPFSLSDPDEIRALLESAGFPEIRLGTGEVVARFAEPADFIRNMELGYAAVIPEFGSDPAAFEAFIEGVSSQARALVRQHTFWDHVMFPMYTNLAVARA
jgi:ubiquinone/menaquinone biosynthesis C-methylase UbiE